MGSFGRAVRHDAIWGTTTDGKSLSLFDTFRADWSLQFNNPMDGTETWHIGWYASGRVWVEGDEELDRVSIQFDVLDDWAHESILASHDFPVEDGSLRLPEGISRKVSVGGATVILDLGYQISPSIGGVRATRNSTFNIVGGAVRLDNVVNKWVVPIMRLLELLTAMPTRVTSVMVRVRDTSLPNSRRGLELHPNLLQAREPRGTSRGQIDMLATRATLEENGLGFPEIMTNYLALHGSENHRMALHYLSRSRSRVLDRSTNSQIVAALSAIELYHSEAIGGSAIPSDDYQKRVEAVVAGAPEEWRHWARDMLSGRNNKGLKRQLMEVMDRAGATGETIRQAWPGPDFCREVVKYRGRAAHGTPASSSSLGSRYYAGAACVRWLLRHVYLLELGLPDAKVGEMIHDNSLFQGEMRTLDEWYRPTSTSV